MGAGAGCSDEYETLRGFLDARFDVHYVAPDGGPDPALDPLTARATFHRVPDVFARGHAFPAPLKRLYWYTAFARASTRAACIAARTVRPHVIFAYTPYGVPAARAAARATDPPAATVTKLFGVRDLVTPGRSVLADWYTNAEAIHAYRSPSTRLLVLDDGTQGDVAARRYGVASSRFLFWANGVNAEWGIAPPSRTRAEVRDALGIPRDAGVVLSVSRLVPYKRVDRLVAAVPALLEARHGAPTAVIIAGDGPTRAALRTRAQQLGVGHAVWFVGAVPHDDVPQYLAASDVFAATSEQTNAGIPTCEALVMGVPVVATDAGATSTLVPHDVAGYIVPPDDAGALAAHLQRVLSDEATRARLAAGAHRVAATRCVDWRTRVSWEVELVRALARDVART